LIGRAQPRIITPFWAPGSGYRIRLANHKRRTVAALRALNFRTNAAGDSYKDTAMLAEADAGILFHPPENVIGGAADARLAAAS
jgi:phosphoserine phosphatase